MRQPWTRVFCLRVVFVVAATSAITLGTSSPVDSAGRAGPDRGHISAVATAAKADCSKAEALRAATRFHLGVDPSLPNPIVQVLCGPFVGPESEAMVASLAIPSCGRTAGWAVFRLAGEAWELVLARNNGANLTAVGSGIKETQYVLRPSDSHCFPTGGTRSRTWHWNGTRMVSGAWKYSKPQPKKSDVLHVPYFKSPSGNIHCGLGDSGLPRLLQPQAAAVGHAPL